MNSFQTETSENREAARILYDADCAFCRASAARFHGILASRGFCLLPLQSNYARQRLNLAPGELPDEMKLVTPAGEILGGIDALIYIARPIWWAKPLSWLARIPGAKPLLAKAYRTFAARRYCLNGVCGVRTRNRGTYSLPLLLLTSAAVAAGWRMPSWLFMWLLAFGLFFGFKWRTWRRAKTSSTPFSRSAAYLLLWPGMDARQFLHGHCCAPPRLGEWAAALFNCAAGLLLLYGVTPTAMKLHPLLAGWCGMAGLILTLHLGAFKQLALFWRAAGIPVQPLMNAPAKAVSLADFWSNRWNRGFRDLTHDLFFRPTARFGAKAGLLLSFLISGLLHDLVISLPARAGFGLPTTYFLLQGAGVLLERSPAGKTLRTGWRGRIFAALIVCGPAFWLFHPPFVRRVILPFLEVIHAIQLKHSS